ncbi:MAG: hypothetical protein M1814_002855 [Vezdaea aestivalis]|nr:MAG: hypothetical protein M1814_002855 [Vezdaea aestivalis]
MADPPKETAKGPSPTLALLRRCHSPDTAKEIFTSKIQHHPLVLAPTTVVPSVLNARAVRRAKRAEKNRRKRALRPQPLSAKQKRESKIHDVADGGDGAWERYAGLRLLWLGYIKDILGLECDTKRVLGKDEAGAMLVGADYHGATVTVVRCNCVGRVGIEGMVVRDGMGIFTLITRKGQVKKIPKEGTIFRLEIDTEGEDGQGKSSANPTFEIHGDGLKYRPAERAGKKFKQRNVPNI